MSQSGSSRRILAGPFSLEQEIKRSRFIAHACPLSDVEADAAHWLAQHHQPDANHHCWAWQFDGQYRFSDDGEPSGTAGRPMLMALEGSGIDQCLVIVVRFFGGIKLGAGGLARAYGGTAAECLRQAPTRQLRRHRKLSLSADFSHSQALFELQQQYDSQPAEPHYSSEGLNLELIAAEEALQEIKASLNNRCRGEVQIHCSDEEIWR